MKNIKLVLSTNNHNKVREIREILKDLPIEVISKKEIGLEGFEIEENGESLEENSSKKATELSKLTDYMVMADDSGIFVNELDGAPGVYSSRYAGEEGNDEKNNAKLLKAMEKTPLERRGASFKVVISLVTESKELINIYGECKGHIDFQLKGARGFGYDPLFIPEGYDKSFGELDASIKNQISHRANALRKTKRILEDLLLE